MFVLTGTRTRRVFLDRWALTSSTTSSCATTRRRPCRPTSSCTGSENSCLPPPPTHLTERRGGGGQAGKAVHTAWLPLQEDGKPVTRQDYFKSNKGGCHKNARFENCQSTPRRASSCNCGPSVGEGVSNLVHRLRWWDAADGECAARLLDTPWIFTEPTRRVAPSIRK